MWHRGKVSKCFTRVIKYFCLTFKQALQDGQLYAWENVLAPAACRCMAKLYLLLPASELISPLSVCATPDCATSFSHSPLLCLISQSLSSQAPACPRDSEPLNIHPLSSIAPRVLLEEGEEGGKKWHWIIQGPIRAISGDCLDLDEMAQRAPVFVCFDVLAPLTPCPSSAVIITGITPFCRGHQMPTFLLTTILHHYCTAQRLQEIN